MASQVDTQQLQQELEGTLRKAERGRRLVTIFKLPLYLGALAFIIFIWTMWFWFDFRNTDSDVIQSQVMTVVFTLFGVIIVGNVVFPQAYAYFGRQEQEVMRRIMSRLFPDIKYHSTVAPQHMIRLKTLRESRILGKVASPQDGGMPATTFSMLETEVDGKPLKIADIGISNGSKGGALRNIPVIGPMILIFKSVGGAAFSSRVESGHLDFRGMFAWSEFPNAFKGTVIVLPDHLEDKLGYLAHNIQSLRSIEGSRLVKMEDPEFEKYFAVYSDDEVAARYILTPPMMHRITELKKKFGRDMMLSFNGNGFYYAVAMPEGFLNLRSGSLTGGRNIIEEIREDIRSACDVIAELKIKN